MAAVVFASVISRCLAMVFALLCVRRVVIGELRFVVCVLAVSAVAVYILWV